MLLKSIIRNNWLPIFSEMLNYYDARPRVSNYSQTQCSNIKPTISLFDKELKTITFMSFVTQKRKQNKRLGKNFKI